MAEIARMRDRACRSPFELGCYTAIACLHRECTRRPRTQTWFQNTLRGRYHIGDSFGYRTSLAAFSTCNTRYPLCTSKHRSSQSGHIYCCTRAIPSSPKIGKTPQLQLQRRTAVYSRALQHPPTAPADASVGIPKTLQGISRVKWRSYAVCQRGSLDELVIALTSPLGSNENYVFAGMLTGDPTSCPRSLG